MSNSPLISGTLLTDNCYTPRAYEITRITPHFMAWYTDAKTCCESFVPASRRASANYCIGKDGEIWLNVDEENGAWTSGNYDNDNRAVTIECANYTDYDDNHVIGQLPDATWNSLVQLCADICLRNGIEELMYTGDDSGNLTMHKWYQNTDCPGPWLSNQFGRLANEVNAILNGDLPDESEDEMVCLIRPDGENYNVFYDGGILHYLGKPQEADAIREVYRQTHGGKEIPYIELGNASDHLGTHFMNAVKRTIP